MNGARKFFTALILLALLVLVLIPFNVEPPKLLFGQPVSELPTSLFPILAAIGILLCSVVELFRSRPPQDPIRPEFPERIDGISALVPLTLILLAATSFDILGYLITTVLAAAILSFAMGNRNLLLLVAGSLSAPVSIYWLVTRLFSTYLPTGIVLPDVFS